MNSIKLKSILKKKSGEFKDYDLHKLILMHKSNNQILKYASFAVSSFKQVSCTFFLQPVYVPSNSFGANYLKVIRDENNRQWWAIETEDDFMQMVEKIKEHEEFLLRIKNSNDFYDYYNLKDNNNIRFREGLAYACCYADRKEKKEVVQALIELIKKEDLTYDWVRECLTRAEELLQAVNKNKHIELLDSWASITKTNLKI